MININDILTYDINWRNSIYDEIFNNKEYEYQNIFVEENDIVADFGANIGIFSLYAEEKKAKKIYAFEPIKEYSLMFKENLKNYSNIVLFESAISYKNDESEIAFNFQNNTIIKEVYNELEWELEWNSSEKKNKIKLISINDFMRNIEKIDFLKIDIEGSEYDVIENITIENLRKIKKIGCEYHWNYNNRLDISIKKLLENNFLVFSFSTNEENKIGKLFAIRKIFNSDIGKIPINYFL
jgi:FkbM family methyltransferase